MIRGFHICIYSLVAILLLLQIFYKYSLIPPSSLFPLPPLKYALGYWSLLKKL
ncbi:hypothetical protein BD408DRAFT_409002 [Parasitella parasitica]|nr:hypothetical protein BD408DRAFT_409002 [Parasitella parasitica]